MTPFYVDSTTGVLVFGSYYLPASSIVVKQNSATNITVKFVNEYSITEAGGKITRLMPEGVTGDYNAFSDENDVAYTSLDALMAAVSDFFFNCKVAVYGGIHAHDNSTSQSITNGTTYEKIVNWNDAEDYKLTLPNALNGNITIRRSGVYRFEGAFSFSAGNNNLDIFIAPFCNDTEIDSIHIVRRISTAGDTGNANFTGLFTLSKDDVVDVRIRHSYASPIDVTFKYMNFNIEKIS